MSNKPSTLNSDLHTLPKDGLAGLKQNWRNDLIAGLSVALVALPLGLGISIASNAPPISGILAAILGGLLTTFLRSSKVAINGPGNGLIVVILVAMESLGEFRYVLAATVVAGFILILCGLLKLGKLGDMLPSSVIQGLLAAIGLIIVGKQIHVAMGTQSAAKSYIGVFQEIPQNLSVMNPFVFLIAILSLATLILHPKIKNKMVHFIPAPIWVLALAIPLVYTFDFFNEHTINMAGNAYMVGPQFLVSLPERLMDSLVFPDFSKVMTGPFWMTVFSITIVGLIETLISTAAIDKLDPFARKTDLNRDLMAVGGTTLVAGLIGSLPVITVIVRSSVNINHGAKTRWSNFFHGSILLGFILLLAPMIQLIPLAALAALLIFSGFKLAAPRIFIEAYRKGPEQFFILVATLYATLKTGLITGIVLGILFTLVVHLVKAGMPFKVFFRFLFKPIISVVHEQEHLYLLHIQGLSNFVTIPALLKLLDDIPKGKRIEVDFTKTYLVDLTVLEFIEDYAEKYRREEKGRFFIIGLDLHQSASDHPHALRIHLPPNKMYRLTRRQEELKELCDAHNWSFEPSIKWGATPSISQFQFFDIRPIEHRNNIIRGEYQNLGIKWQICDVTFDEGALLATEVYRTTVQIMELGQHLPIFTLEQEELFDKLLSLTGFEDIDFKMFTQFSQKFLLKGLDENAIRAFFTPKMIKFFESEDIYHLESNGHALFIFKYYRLASPRNIEKMVDYSERLLTKLQAFSRQLPPLDDPDLEAAAKSSQIIDLKSLNSDD